MKNNNLEFLKNDKLKKVFKSKGMSSFYSSLIAITCGLIVGFIVMLIINPTQAFAGLGNVIAGGFSGGNVGIANVFYYATPIIMTGLSVGFAFKTGLFNIGATGQYTMGMYFALYAAFMWQNVIPNAILWIVCILMGILGGAIWGIIPGLFKAFLNVNEVITAIMFNYIGMYLVDMLIKNNGAMFTATQQRTKVPPIASNVPKMGLNYIFPNTNINGGILIAILAAIILWVILNKTTFGYELKACGYNKEAARYAGINSRQKIIISMVIAGAMAGLGGALMILAGNSNIYEPINSLAANGFTGIPVALLGMSNPLAIVVAGLFISHLQRGGFYIQLLNFSPEIIDVIIGVIIYFSAFALIFKNILATLSAKNKKKKCNR
ncbi:MAG TPA: ABC transporter permease [Clostridia bacterium]|nr:ABC transporter permease [Clostridia bacterium]